MARRVLLILGALSLAVFILPTPTCSGSGPISVRGPTPFEREWKMDFGLLLKPWGSVELSDLYDGKTHSSKVNASVQSSPIWWFGWTGLFLILLAFAIKRTPQ